MAIKRIDTPNFITNTEWELFKQDYQYTTEEDLAVDDILILNSFGDRIAVVEEVASGTLVKVNSDGVDTPLAQGDVLDGYEIGWKASVATPAGTLIKGQFSYWSQIG